jgi:phosphatidylinositol N-acetylglucosaminyltransferase subunit H
VVVLPPHGIQIEIQRGYPGIPLFMSRHFIPIGILRDVVINEGLKGWDVKYYLTALVETVPGSFGLTVVYEVGCPSPTPPAFG